MTRVTRYFGVLTAALAGSAIAIVAGQQSPVPRAVHGGAGRRQGAAVYQANCASCHVADLGGRNEAPQLAGGDFMNTWRNRTTADLFDYMSSTMPPGGPSLAPDQYASVVAYILQQNGAQPGATGIRRRRGCSYRHRCHRPASDRGAECGAGGGFRRWTRRRCGCRRAGRGGAARVQQARGVTVAGEVKNYVPVTDEMLKTPPAGDWLMARRTYSGQSYSPLDRDHRRQREGPEAGLGLER